MQRAQNKIIKIIIKEDKRYISRNPYPPHVTTTYPISPHHSFVFQSSPYFTVALPLSFIFFFQQHIHTYSLSHTLIRSLSLPLSLSLVNHHNYWRNSGRIYRRKTIGDFLGSICFQYFKVRTLNLRFLYFVSFFTNLSNLSVICDLI